MLQYPSVETKSNISNDEVQVSGHDTSNIMKNNNWVNNTKQIAQNNWKLAKFISRLLKTTTTTSQN